MTTRTLKRLERAAMRWWRYFDMRHANGVDHDLMEAEIGRAELGLSRSCAAHAQRKGAKRKGR